MQKEPEWKGEDESQTNGKSDKMVFHGQQNTDLAKSLFTHLDLYSSLGIRGFFLYSPIAYSLNIAIKETRHRYMISILRIYRANILFSFATFVTVDNSCFQFLYRKHPCLYI